MPDRFLTTADRIRILDDAGDLAFDTSNRPAALIPGAEINLGVGTPYTITWPDYSKDDLYFWSGAFPTGSTTTEEAHAFIGAIPQEWNYAALSPYNLPDILLGTVPVGTDYLDIQLNMTRTTSPTQVIGTDIYTYLQGDNLNPVGVSVIVEKLFPFVRLMEFVLDGTNVYLRRWQSCSTSDMTTVAGQWSPTNSPADRGYFTYGSVKSVPVYINGDYGPATLNVGNNFSHQRGGGNQISLTDTTDFSSVYSGTVTITPGRLNAPAATVNTDKRVIHTDYHNPASAGGTFLARNFGYAHSTRKMVVSIVSSSGDASAVTIGGVAATNVVSANNAGLVCSLWVASVPTGTTGTVAISGTAQLQYEIFAMYNVGSGTPTDTKTSTAGSPSFTLTTPNPGVAIVGRGSGALVAPASLSGIETVYIGPTQQMKSAIGYQATTGISLSVVSGASTGGAMVGASFS